MNNEEAQTNLDGGASASTAGLGVVALPATRDVWKQASRRRQAIARALAPIPKALRYYPELPHIGQRVWALWRCGSYGVAEYKGAWTYKTEGGAYLNEMPVCWHDMKPNVQGQGRCATLHRAASPAPQG